MDASPALRRNTLKGLKWALLGALALYALYLVAGNAFLNTSLGESAINRRPERFQMHWSGGTTWWPGRVTLRKVELQGHSGRLRWSASAARAQGRIALWPLWRKELRVPEVRADDVRGGLRRVDENLPPPPPRSGGWTLRFDRIASDSVRGGNFNDVKLEGDGRAQAGFVKQLRGGPMELLPSTVEFQRAHAVRGDDEWLRDGTLKAKFAIARHTRAEAAGLQKLQLSDIELELQGSTAALSAAMDAQGRIAMKAMPGQGRIVGRLAYARGRLLPGGKLRWQMPVVTADPDGVSHRDDLQVALDVDQDLALSAYMPPQAGGIFGLDADLHLKGAELPLRDFRSQLPRASGHVAGQWRFSSLRWLTRLFTDAPWLSLDGAGDVSADVQLKDGRIAAGSRFDVPDIAAVAEVMGNRIEGRARAEGSFEAGADGALAPRLDIAMQRFRISAADAPGRPYVQGNDLRLALNAGGVATLRDTLRARLRFDNAQVPDLRVYNRYLPNEQLRIDGGSGTLGGDLQLDAAGEIGSGWVRMAGRDARLRMAGVALRGNVGVDLRLRRADLAKRSFVADGSDIRLDGVSFAQRGGETRGGWSAQVTLPRARLDWRKPIAVGGDAQLAMKDVGFLLALFARDKEIPDWVYKLVDAGPAQASGRVQWRGDTLVLDRLAARNDRFDLLGRLRLKGQARSGQLFAQWGKLSVGMDLQGDQHKLHLRDAREWYQAQPALLP